ncbi:MAG: hypothetical protein JWO78_2302 [Micavibrio sp.]|nr:hypothetical protein [Micavibrio sp.]
MSTQELLNQFNISAIYSASIPDRAEEDWLNKFIDIELESSEHILFGEAHINGTILKTYALLAKNPKVFQTAAEKGIGHLSLEFSHTFQPYLKQYGQNKISRKEFQYRLFEDPLWHYVPSSLSGNAEKQFRDYFLQAIDNALVAGMTVHFADFSCERMVSAQQKELVEIEVKIEKERLETEPQVPFEQYAFKYIMKLPQEERSRLVGLWMTSEKSKMDLRLDDTEQYNYLDSRMKSGEGLWAIAGFSHLDESAPGSLGLAQHLRQAGAKVTSVEIYDRPETRCYFQACYAMSERVKGRQPDYTIMLDENSIFDHRKNLNIQPNFQLA